MRITLTFDNGPEPDTSPQVLEVLARHRILSTFFVLGSKASTAEGGALMAQMTAAGHWIGNHTWSHRTPLGLLDAAASLEELERTHDVLVAAGIRQRLFRPFGRAGRIGTHLLNPAAVEWLQSRAYTCVLWNCVPGDWRDPDGWCERGVADVRTRPWSVVVLHDLPTGAMRHLDAFITQLEREGAEFVQGFPAACTPIESGRITLPLTGYVTESRGGNDLP